MGESYTVASGGTISGGRYRLPLWARGVDVGQIIQIPNSHHSGTYPGEAENAYSGARSQTRLAYSGAGLVRGKYALGAPGGHGDSSDNSFTIFDLLQDYPDWVILHMYSAVVQADVPYYPDGTPSSRHTYWSTHWNPFYQRMMLYGARSVYGSAVHYDTCDGFNLETNQWDPAGTYPNTGAAMCVDEYGNAWEKTAYALKRIDVATLDQTITHTSVTAIHASPIEWDSKRKQLFGLCQGDGFGTGTTIYASVFSNNGTVYQPITLSPGAALDLFIAENTSYLGLQYDPINDVFWAYNGRAGYGNSIYKITPNAGTTWTIESFVSAVGSVVPVDMPGPGALNRFRYVPELGGLVWLARADVDMYYIRTS